MIFSKLQTVAETWFSHDHVKLACVVLAGFQTAFTLLDDLPLESPLKAAILKNLAGANHVLKKFYRFEQWVVYPTALVLGFGRLLVYVNNQLQHLHHCAIDSDSLGLPHITQLRLRLLKATAGLIAKLISLCPKWLLKAPERAGSQALLLLFIAYTANLASRFIWRLRANYRAYAQADAAACRRDMLEYSPPHSIFFDPALTAYSVITNPIFFGLERVIGLARAATIKTDMTRANAERILAKEAGNQAAADRAKSMASKPNPQPLESDCKDVGRTGSPGCPDQESHQPKVAMNTNLPDANQPEEFRPLLFVGNHTTLGMDMPTLVWYLYKTTGLYVRGLAHNGHFNFPLWGRFIRWCGGIPGTRECGTDALEQGFALIVYPGGSREVMKKKNDADYPIIWGERAGFAKIAIASKAIIIPISSVGSNDMFPIMGDVPFNWLFGRRSRAPPTTPVLMHPLQSPSAFSAIMSGRAANKRFFRELTTQTTKRGTPLHTPTIAEEESNSNDEMDTFQEVKLNPPPNAESSCGRRELPPKPKGTESVTLPLICPFALHRWQRYYFSFGEPIDTKIWLNREDDEVACAEVRDIVKAIIQRDIDALKQFQAHDPYRLFFSRLWYGTKRIFKRPADTDNPFIINTFFTPCFEPISRLQRAMEKIGHPYQ